MARKIEEIQDQIISTMTTDPHLSTYTWSDSKVAMWRLWTFVVAVCIWTLEELFDAHRSEMELKIGTMRPHKLSWYVYKAKAFQYGVALPPDSDEYAESTEDMSVAIVQYAAAIELLNMIRIKVAKGPATALEGLTAPELSAFTAYMNRIKDAGVRLHITSDAPDIFRVSLKIFYDPLVLTAAGSRIDGTSINPVIDAVKAFLADLPFNGVFILNKFIAALQAIEGVKIGQVLAAHANYASTAFVPITVKYTPDAGYMKLDETHFAANISYEAYLPE
jgi:hypothetical protein